ncbi:MAG: hypothetical protein ACLQJ7_16890 [Syntrophobacteraceae bacterium]
MQYTDIQAKNQPFISFDPEDCSTAWDFTDPELQPIPGLVGLGLIVILCKRELINPRNFVVEQLCRAVFNGDDFLGYRANQGRVLLCSTERHSVCDRGIIPPGIDLRDAPKPIPPVPEIGNDNETTRRNYEPLKEWCSGYLDGGHTVVVLGPWYRLRARIREWYEVMLGFMPRVDEAARGALFDDFQKGLVQTLRQCARERGITIIVMAELTGTGSGPGRDFALNGADGQMWLNHRKGQYVLEIPELSSNQCGPARTIPLQRNDRSWFEKASTGGGGKGANWLKDHPEDEQIMKMLAANRRERYTLEETVRKCGGQWPEEKQPYYKTLERRLVPAGKARRYEPDTKYRQITYACEE